MGITVTTISLDFEQRLWSPGMQLIEGEANASNLLSWLSFQLRRLDIKLSHLSSVSTDNASNISKATFIDADLNSVTTRCLCHLLNIAIKRVTTNN
jgi:hypothetical protein